jgi:hypothetical protein
MKKKLSVISIVLGALVIEPSAPAQMAGRYGGQGRGDGRGISRPGGANVGAGGGGVGRGLGVSRPSGGVGNFRPPMTSIPQGAPISRPNLGGMRVPNAQPMYRTIPRPQTTWRGGGGNVPSLGAIRRIPNRPDFQRPAANQLPRPVQPAIPGSVTADGRRGFATLPPDRLANGAPRLVRPDGGKLRVQPVQPGQTAGGSQSRPNNLLRPNRPGQFGGLEQLRPGSGGQFNPDLRPGQANRPSRPIRPNNWQNIATNSASQWNLWKNNNNARINNFRNNRFNSWNNIDSRFRQRDWAGRFGSDEFCKW